MNNKDMRLFSRSVMAVCAICIMMAVSCEEPAPPIPPVEPSFPAVVEKNDVEPGSVLTLTFDAEMDWTVTLPAESLQWFWLQDGSFKVDRVSGKVAEGDSERITVSIGVSEIEEFDANRSCEVTLSMGGKSQVIARYMRPAMNRTLSVYAAKVENGEFVLDAAGGYVYETEDASSLDFIWSVPDADFRMPVKVESNSSWTADVPEWLDLQVPENTSGVLEIILTGASVDEASGRIEFKAGDSTLKEVDVHVPACGVVELYSTKQENGDFLFDDSGDYMYTEQPVDEITLIWPGSDFRMPVLVDSKCDWELELPKWLTMKFNGDEPERKAGVVKFMLMGDPRYYPLDETTEKIVFSFDGKVIREIDVTIPGCKDRFGFGLDMALTSWEFNPEGYLMTSAGFQDISASAWFTGTSHASVFAVETVEGKSLGHAPEWLTMDVQAYVQGGETLQQRTVTIRPSENDGVKRTAYILFSNGTDAASFFEADGTLKKEMEEYAVTLVQYGSDMEYVTMTSTDEEMAAAGVSLVKTDNPRLTAWFGSTDFMYEMTYSNPYARDKAFMSFAKPYSTYRIFNNAREDVTSDGGFWLSFTPNDSENRTGVVDMYMDMTPSESRTAGYVVLYDSGGSVLAIIVAVYDPDKFVDAEVTIEFIGESAAYAEMVGATLEEVTEETDKELYDVFKEYAAPVYHLTYRMKGMPMRISVPAAAVKYNPNPYNKRNVFVVNGLDYDETAGDFDLIDGGVDIYMIPDDASSVYEHGQILFHAEDNTVVLVLVCTLDLSDSF